jgi:hypothetical protein
MPRVRRRHRILIALFVALISAGWILLSNSWQAHHHQATPSTSSTTSSASLATTALASLPVKGRAPMTGYSRQQFGGDWATVGGCDMREHILGRDLTDIQYRSTSDCTVLGGTLTDPYTSKTIAFRRGVGTSNAVQIDHVVAIGDAWQKGAQQLTAAQRKALYNDPLELLAVDGPANEQKGDGDAATWLPHNKAYRCRYVARQIAVKQKYHLWVTAAEHDAMARILSSCPGQSLPTVTG